MKNIIETLRLFDKLISFLNKKFGSMSDWPDCSSLKKEVDKAIAEAKQIEEQHKTHTITIDSSSLPEEGENIILRKPFTILGNEDVEVYQVFAVYRVGPWFYESKHGLASRPSHDVFHFVGCEWKYLNWGDK